MGEAKEPKSLKSPQEVSDVEITEIPLLNTSNPKRVQGIHSDRNADRWCLADPRDDCCWTHERVGHRG